MSGHSHPWSWTSATLSDVADVVQGQSPPGSTYNVDGIGVPFFQGKAEFGPIHPIAKKWCTEPTKFAEPGDVLISIRAPVGPTNLSDARCCIGRGLAAIRLSDQIPPRFLLYYLRHTDRLLARQATGSTFQAISGAQLRAHQVLVPPLPEQHRIVSAIESYFTRLDDAVATLERVQRNLKRYRASVLKAAVEGRLVPTEAELAGAEGRSYESASVLLSRILVERRHCWEEAELAKMTAKGKTPKDDKWKAKYVEPAAPDTNELPELPEGWCWASVDQLAVETQIGLVRNRAAQRSYGGFPYIKMDQIDLDGTVRMEGSVRVDASTEEVDRFSLADGDILFNTRNSVELVGKSGLVRSPLHHALFNNNIMRIRTASGAYSPFVAVQMCSSLFRGQIEKVKRATTSVAAVYGKDLLPRAIALPPRAEQERIMADIERLLSINDSARNMAQLSLARLARLRQSILWWAFEGRLVDQDPADEPASALLERIRAERASTTDTPSRHARRAKARAPQS